MTEEEQIDIIIDILTDFDEMGFAPTTTVPDPETYAIKWRNKLTDALKDYRNRQKAEIERLIEECGKQSVLWRKHFESIFETAKETARAEAVKEFAEQVIDLIYEADDINPVTEWKIRNLLKAFTEEKT